MLASLFCNLLAIPLATASVCARSACNADNCLRAVRASSHAPFPSSATADCSSFLRKTVTPCVVTSTQTNTVTVTTSPAVVTKTATTQVTQVNTQVNTVTSVETTIEFTQTLIEPTEVDVTQTSYSTVVQSVAPVRRAAVMDRLPPPVLLDAKLKARSASITSGPASTCAAATGSPTNVPPYASACSGQVRYSSACSCAGVTAATTTLTASTTIVTSTSTVIYTPTSTATAVEPVTVPVTTTVTQIIPTTFQTTDATVIIPSAFTVTSQVVVPTTVVVNYCNSYKFLATSGTFTGQFITGGTPSSLGAYGNPMFSTDPTQALTYVFHSDGTVYANNIDVLAAPNNDFDYIYQLTDGSLSTYPSTYPFTKLICSVTGTAPVAGAAGMFSCTESGNAIVLQTCAAGTTSGRTTYLLKAGSLQSTCVEAGLAAISQGQVPC